jgi:hypothetical protein
VPAAAKERRKRRPKSAAPPPAAVPSPAAQLAALTKLELMGSQKGTPKELALDAARRSDTVLKPPAHKPLAISGQQRQPHCKFPGNP